MNDAIASDVTGEGGEARNIVREAVGVFDTPAHLEAAVEQLEFAGIDRAAHVIGGKQIVTPIENAFLYVVLI